MSTQIQPLDNVIGVRVKTEGEMVLKTELYRACGNSKIFYQTIKELKKENGFHDRYFRWRFRWQIPKALAAEIVWAVHGPDCAIEWEG